MKSKSDFNIINFTFVYLLFLLLIIPIINNHAQNKIYSNKNSIKKTQTNVSDQLTLKQTVSAKDLFNELKKTSRTKPLIFNIGFDFLYGQGHIPGSIYAGPASNSNGLAKLKLALKNVPLNKNIVIYCGCCEWNECPNVRPAYKTLVDLGYKNVKVLYLENNFTRDWEKKGYPVSR